MSTRIHALRRKISRPNGRKAINRLHADLVQLIDRAPDHPSLKLYARSALGGLIKSLDQLYADL